MTDLVDISLVDSKTNNKITYAIVNECVVPIPKVKLKDSDYVLTLIDNICYLGKLKDKANNDE